MNIGIVTATDPATCKCRVRFSDQDGMESYWLPVLHHKTGRDKSYWMPDLGEHVCCLLDENAEFGCILGAIYSDADQPPVNSQDKYHQSFSDGTIIEYDRYAHKLTAYVVGTLEATVDVSATITSPVIRAVASTKVQCDTPLTECTGDLVVNGGITSLGAFGGSGGKITTPGDIESTGGSISVPGNVTAGGNVIDGGGNTNHHTH